MAASVIQIYNGAQETIAGPAATMGSSGVSNCAWQAIAFDFCSGGTANYWADNWAVEIQVAMATTASNGQTLDVYIGYGSTSNTNNYTYPGGIGTVGNASAVYTGYGTTAGGLPLGIQQLEYVGSLVLANVTTAQMGIVGIITPKMRYGVVVIGNNSSGTVSSASNTITMIPILDEVGA